MTLPRPPVAIYYHDHFLLHDTGAGHPEKPGRLTAILEGLRRSGLSQKVAWPDFAPATWDECRRVHTEAYLDIAEVACRQGLAVLPTGDTSICRESFEIARLAAGAVISAAGDVADGKFSSGLCLVRPPGHHATPGRGMGFCILNNVAIAARHLLATRGLNRILIVDFDVHHGNGTQDTFLRDGSVFYYSAHQKGIYPGTGKEVETGEGPGKGKILNVELSKGSGDREALAAFDHRLIPAMKIFKPEFILVSAGFDAHHQDPLGSLKITRQGYGELAHRLLAMADRYANGKTVFTLEGGYDEAALSESVVEIVTQMIGRS